MNNVILFALFCHYILANDILQFQCQFMLKLEILDMQFTFKP